MREDIERMWRKIRNVLKIRHMVSGNPLSLYFLDIEPAANNSEIYHVEYLKNMKSKLSHLTERKIIYHNASDVELTSTPRRTAHTEQDAWNVALNNVLYKRHNQQRAYIVGNRIRLATEVAKSTKKS
jgi:hypothetical protein